MSKICHRLIAETAKGIANEAYEIMASNDNFYRAWPNRTRFVQKHWKDFIGHARASLIVMLTPIPGTENDQDGAKYLASETARDAIMEAFLHEGPHKHVPQPAMPTAGEIARYGGLN